MPEKPFIAARIPENLNQALTQYVEESGLNRTEVIVNALVTYLKLPTSFTQGNKNSTRLDLLEERILNLEKVAGISNFSPEPSPKTENSLPLKTANEEIEHKEIEILTTNKNHYKEESEEITLSLFSLNDERLTHKELSEITGISYNTIKSKGRIQGAEVRHNQKIYTSIKPDKKVYWIVKISSNTDTEDSIDF